MELKRARRSFFVPACVREKPRSTAMHKSAVLSGILHAALLSTIVIGLWATVRPAPQQLVFGIEVASDPVDDSNAATVPSPIRAPVTSGEETGFLLGFSRMAEPSAAADAGEGTVAALL